MDRNAPLTEAVFYILLAVKNPNHGYGIIQMVSDMTKTRVILGPGTLYGAINSLLEKGLITLYSEEKQSRRKKQYVITDEGRKAVRDEIHRLEELLENSKCLED